MEKLKNHNSGFSLIETLVALGVMGFIVLTILNGFAQQQLRNRNTSSKNIAISLAETKMEELFKFPSTHLTIGTTTDYIVAGKNSYQITSDPPDVANEFKRTWSISLNGSLMQINIDVEYGKKLDSSYPFKISLTSQRGA